MKTINEYISLWHIPAILLGIMYLLSANNGHVIIALFWLAIILYIAWWKKGINWKLIKDYNQVIRRNKIAFAIDIVIFRIAAYLFMLWLFFYSYLFESFKADHSHGSYQFMESRMFISWAGILLVYAVFRLIQQWLTVKTVCFLARNFRKPQ